MVATIARNDTSLIGLWWWTVDRGTLFAVMMLMCFGVLLSFAASPSVASTIGLSSFYFVLHHLVYLIPTVFLIISVSLLSPKAIKRLALFLFLGSAVLMILTMFMGAEIKGAKRWLSLGLFSIQPSEFIKPAFAVMSAWMFTEKQIDPEVPGTLIAFILYAITTVLLILQPDLGMVVLTTMVWFTQFFLAGLPILWIMGAGVAGFFGLAASYFFLPHVTRRIDQFLDPSSGDRFSENYQVSQSLEAFMNGGFLGQGPGEGVVKKTLPDAHADFVFAVAGEEFGLVVCLLIAGLFVAIILRSLARSVRSENYFILLAVTGLVVQFGLQAMINIASTINLIPTKGMTLPFVSYGGSSMLALAITMGMILALTRRRVDGHNHW